MNKTRVYLFTGFLESGKSSFIQDTLLEQGFGEDEKTLIIACEEGEVDASVFDRYRDPLYKEASFKPYIIAAMIFLAKFENPTEILKKLEERGCPRIFE